MKPPAAQSSSTRALFVVITDDLGGAERVAFGLASELACRGWNVDVITIAAKLAHSAAKEVLPPTVRLRYGPSKNWYVSLLALPARLLFCRYDLVFSTQVYTNGILCLLRRMKILRTAKLVVRESSSTFDAYRDASPFRKRALKWLYDNYGSEDLLIAQTAYMGDHVRAHVSSRSAAQLQVMANPIDLPAIRKSAGEPMDPELGRWLNEAPTILFCGRHIEIKQPRLALTAFSLLVRSGCHAQLVFVGGGPLEEPLVAECERLGLTSKVKFLGRLINPYPVMSNCRYGLVTSYREGFPNVILEMMACRYRKIVTTRCAGDLDALTGVTVTRSFDPGEIAKHLADAINSGEDQGKAYEREVQRRTMASYVDRILQWTSDPTVPMSAEDKN